MEKNKMNNGSPILDTRILPLSVSLTKGTPPGF